MNKDARYRIAHPERVRQSHADHYQRHREEISAHKKQYYADHKEDILTRMRVRAPCPYCHKELCRRYLKAHIVRKHVTKEA